MFTFDKHAMVCTGQSFNTQALVLEGSFVLFALNFVPSQYIRVHLNPTKHELSSTDHWSVIVPYTLIG